MTDWVQIEYASPSEPLGWIDTKINQERELIKWCQENCTGHWIVRQHNVEFSNDKDAMLFTLRWL